MKTKNEKKILGSKVLENRCKRDMLAQSDARGWRAKYKIMRNKRA